MKINLDLYSIYVVYSRGNNNNKTINLKELHEEKNKP